MTRVLAAALALGMVAVPVTAQTASEIIAQIAREMNGMQVLRPHPTQDGRQRYTYRASGGVLAWEKIYRKSTTQPLPPGTLIREYRINLLDVGDAAGSRSLHRGVWGIWIVCSGDAKCISTAKSEIHFDSGRVARRERDGWRSLWVPFNGESHAKRVGRLFQQLAAINDNKTLPQAARDGHPAAVEMLINAGADVNSEILQIAEMQTPGNRNGVAQQAVVVQMLRNAGSRGTQQAPPPPPSEPAITDPPDTAGTAAPGAITDPPATSTQAARTGERALALTRAQRRTVQDSLNRLGYDAGVVDGLFGPRTRQAIRALQRVMGLEETGFLDGDILGHLRQNVLPDAPETVGPARDCVTHAFTGYADVASITGQLWHSHEFTNRCAHRVTVRWRDNSWGRCNSVSTIGLGPRSTGGLGTIDVPVGTRPKLRWCVERADGKRQEASGYKSCFAANRPGCP